MPAQGSPGRWELRPPRERVDPRCLAWWSCQLVGTALVSCLALAVSAVLIAAARPWLLLAAGVVAALTLPDVLIVPRTLMRIHRWEVTDEAVFTRSGLIWQQWRAAPLSRVQTIDTDRGPLQRLFRLTTITVSTASAKGPLRIEALDAERAEQLAQRLTSLTEQQPAAPDPPGALHASPGQAVPAAPDAPDTPDTPDETRGGDGTSGRDGDRDGT